MKLLDFYKNVIKTMKLETTEDGYIMVKTGEDSMLPVTIGDKSLVLPTKENIDTMYSKQEDGSLKIEKVLFNPLDENVVKGDSMSLKKTKAIVERVAGHSVGMAGELLLMLAKEPEFQKKTNTDLNKFLGAINAANNNGIKKLVDDKSVDTWRKLYKKTINDSKGMVTVFLKKKGVLDGESFHRLGTMKFPIYDELLEADKTTPIHGIRLRPKDITIFKIIFEFLAGVSEEKPYVKYGSNDNTSPAFLTLMKLYLPLVNRSNKIIRSTKHIDAVVAESGTVPVAIKEKDLDDVISFKGELVTIPNELDLNRVKAKQNTVTDVATAINSTPVPDEDIFIKRQPQQEQMPVVQQQAQPQVQQVVPQQPQQPQQQAPVDTLDKIDQAMFGNNQMLNQGTSIMQPALPQAQPMGVNAMQPQVNMMVPQQPMYGQPVMNQGMIQQPMGAPMMQQQQPMGINTMGTMGGVRAW